MSGEYDEVFCNVPVTKGKRRVAEIDLLCCKEGFCDVFEVKCSFRITKAKLQVRKIKKHADLPVRYCFFHCGASGATIRIG